MRDRTRLRRQDFWTSLALIAASVFFLAQTSKIPFFRANAAGVESGQWYNSAALVPYAIFTLILVLAVALLTVSVGQGGAPAAGQVIAVARWIRGAAGARMVAAAIIILAYIFALVPRVDFTIASALTLFALIYGFHELRPRATAISVIFVLLPAGYALWAHMPQSEWNAPHDDDWLTLGSFVALGFVAMLECRLSTGRIGGYIRVAPFIAALVPLFLVGAMAFGFRQNVPNRTGLLFKQIEYHYFVHVRPWLSGRERG